VTLNRNGQRNVSYRQLKTETSIRDPKNAEKYALKVSADHNKELLAEASLSRSTKQKQEQMQRSITQVNPLEFTFPFLHPQNGVMR
jgi:hypothetical protein